MKKGQTRRVWTPEQKAEIVHKHLNEHISVRTLEKEYHADRSMICKWVKKYIAEGESFTLSDTSYGSANRHNFPFNFCCVFFNLVRLISSLKNNNTTCATTADVAGYG